MPIILTHGEEWLDAQVQRRQLRRDDDASCFWPRTYGAARCLCEPRFAGQDCSGCARGFSGADCREPRVVEVRRSFRNVSYEAAGRWAAMIGRTLHSMPPAVSFAPENEVSTSKYDGAGP